MDLEKARYIFAHHGDLLNKQERAANRHLTGTAKITRGRSDAAAQIEAAKSPSRVRELLSEDPQVLELARYGYDSFVLRTAERILTYHADKIAFNHCPQCGRLARTPKARQCRYCRHDWHSKSTISK
jgi:hypothetical protein